MKINVIQKTTLLFLSFFLITLTSFSQKAKEFAPVGAEWTYDWYDGWNAASIYEKVISEYKSNDSIFKITKRREATILNYERVADRKLLVLGDSVFEFNNGRYRFIFSNSFAVGDTIKMDAWENYPTESKVNVVIDSVGEYISSLDTIKLTYTSTFDLAFKYNRDRFFFQFGDENGKIYHNIGPDAGKLYGDWSGLDGAARPRLMCYTEDSFSLFNSSTSCKTQYLTIVGLYENINSKHGIRIFPNPATRYIAIEGEGFHNNHISIINSLGLQVYSGKIEKSKRIQIDHLPAGFYIVKVGQNPKKPAFFKLQIIH